jgi:hypothetical protein
VRERQHEPFRKKNIPSVVMNDEIPTTVVIDAVDQPDRAAHPTSDEHGLSISGTPVLREPRDMKAASA